MSETHHHYFTTKIDVSKLSILSLLIAHVEFVVTVEPGEDEYSEWEVHEALDERGRVIDHTGFYDDWIINQEMQAAVDNEMSSFDYDELREDDDGFGMPFDMSINSF